MNEDLGQKTDTWKDLWDSLSPEAEIQKWDFFGLRPWILKYTPRNGKVIEAGCGLGQLVFYMAKMDIEIEGLDFEEKTIEFIKEWQIRNGYHSDFTVGNVTDMPYEDNSLSGYLSFGVVEHFVEGPHRPLNDAFRALRPGGIAIVTTPNQSWVVRYARFRKRIKRVLKKVLGKKEATKPFFQYEYTPDQLKNFLETAGFKVTRHSGADLMFAFFQQGKDTGTNLEPGSFAYRNAEKYEQRWPSKYGAQSVTISVKVADKMHCFHCDELEATPGSLKKFEVPVCAKCEETEYLKYYKIGEKTAFHHPYQIKPELMEPHEVNCDFCEQSYETDPIFENNGFTKNVCAECLKKPAVNIEVSNEHLQPIWRNPRDLVE